MVPVQGGKCPEGMKCTLEEHQIIQREIEMPGRRSLRIQTQRKLDTFTFCCEVCGGCNIPCWTQFWQCNPFNCEHCPARRLEDEEETFQDEVDVALTMEYHAGRRSLQAQSNPTDAMLAFLKGADEQYSTLHQSIEQDKTRITKISGELMNPDADAAALNNELSYLQDTLPRKEYALQTRLRELEPIAVRLANECQSHGSFFAGKVDELIAGNSGFGQGCIDLLQQPFFLPCFVVTG